MKKFDQLAEIMDTKTRNFSGSSYIELPEYKAILKMGEKAVPLILNRLKTAAPLGWNFAVLFSLTKYAGNDYPIIPDKIFGQYDLIAETWIKWGEEKGLLTTQPYVCTTEHKYVKRVLGKNPKLYTFNVVNHKVRSVLVMAKVKDGIVNISAPVANITGYPYNPNGTVKNDNSTGLIRTLSYLLYGDEEKIERHTL